MHKSGLRGPIVIEERPLQKVAIRHWLGTFGGKAAVDCGLP